MSVSDFKRQTIWYKVKIIISTASDCKLQIFIMSAICWQSKLTSQKHRHKSIDDQSFSGLFQVLVFLVINLLCAEKSRGLPVLTKMKRAFWCCQEQEFWPVSIYQEETLLERKPEWFYFFVLRGKCNH